MYCMCIYSGVPYSRHPDIRTPQYIEHFSLSRTHCLFSWNQDGHFQGCPDWRNSTVWSYPAYIIIERGTKTYMYTWMYIWMYMCLHILLKVASSLRKATTLRFVSYCIAYLSLGLTCSITHIYYVYTGICSYHKSLYVHVLCSHGPRSLITLIVH